MVMIDLVAEKKSLGFSSVTQVTEALLVGYLLYTPLARKRRSDAMGADGYPGSGRLADMSRTERKCIEPAETGQLAQGSKPFARFAAAAGGFRCPPRRFDAGGRAGGTPGWRGVMLP